MRRTAILLLLIQFFIPMESKAEENKKNVAEIFHELAAHPFHPLNDGNSMTVDKSLKKDGIADLNNTDW